MMSLHWAGVVLSATAVLQMREGRSSMLRLGRAVACEQYCTFVQELVWSASDQPAGINRRGCYPCLVAHLSRSVIPTSFLAAVASVIRPVVPASSLSC